MDSIQQRHFTIQTPQPKTFDSVQLKPRHKSPQAEKQKIIHQIRNSVVQCQESSIKQQTLQNTISDLKKLLLAVGNENSSYMKQVEEENAILSDKAARLSAALTSSHKNGKHLQKCALFWKEFVH